MFATSYGAAEPSRKRNWALEDFELEVPRFALPGMGRDGSLPKDPRKHGSKSHGGVTNGRVWRCWEAKPLWQEEIIVQASEE